jgi:LPS export ABC transporter protein LptC
MKNIYGINIFILIIILLLGGCSGDEAISTDRSGEKASTTEQVLLNSQINLSQDGRTTAVIEADYIEKRFGAKNTYAKVITAHFYDSTGVETSWLVADSGEVAEQNNQLEVWGNVHVTTKDSITLDTESLKWDQLKNRVITEDFVEIHTKTDIIRGYGFESDRTLNHHRSIAAGI